MAARPVAVKVGGSLFDLPDLGFKLVEWLRVFGQNRVILVPGGGRFVDCVRELDRRETLGGEKAHWLALKAVTLSAWFLHPLVPNSGVVAGVEDCPALWDGGRIPILDLHAFAQADEGRPGALPHSWDVTSDSFAARVASVIQADRLILLKSATIPPEMDWDVAANAGLVDRHFPKVVAPGIEIVPVNFRLWPEEPQNVPVPQAGQASPDQ
jgi:aspartokinase-like uncharacterized kinase